jgi:hypothetical protein
MLERYVIRALTLGKSTSKEVWVEFRSTKSEVS